jgi:hypothetical protein
MVIERNSTNAETHEAERVVQAVISLTRKERQGKERRNATVVEANIVQFGCSMEERKRQRR